MPQPDISILVLCNHNRACISVKEILAGLPFSVTICQSYNHAIDTLLEQKFDIVISEYDLEKYTGVQFLQQAATIDTFSTRLIVGDKANEDVIIKAVVKGIACAYLDSSSSMDMVKAKLVDLSRVHTSMDNKRIQNIKTGTNSFPIVMTTYENLMNAINMDYSIGQIAKIISSDVTLTSKILQVANSAFYGSFTGTSVEKAIIYMGLNTVRDIVLMHSLSVNLNMTSDQNRCLEETVRHSIVTNYYLHTIVHKYKVCTLSSLNNSVGIIHDIGKIIQMVFFPQEHKSIEEFREENVNTDYYTSELESGNASVAHTEIGGYFLKIWNFNQYAIESALFHHTPELASENTKPCVEALFLANTLADIRDGFDLSLEEAVGRCTMIKADVESLMAIEPPFNL
ncbi:MAG: HDOD domain-containing protein [Deferribacterales bacterium]